VEEGVVAHQEIEAVQAVFGSLTEEQQQVLVLRFMEGYSLEQSATIMGKTPGAVKALQHRALRALARQLTNRNPVRGGRERG
jgi:RNA polymerase sigma-70 factor (ECF subfamily)